MKPMRWPSIRPSVRKWPRAVAGNAEAANTRLADGLGGSGFARGGIGERRRARRHLVRRLRHDGAEDDHDGGKNHKVTHHATLDEICNITTSAAKPRLIAADEAVILTKRMSETLTGFLLTSPRLRGEVGLRSNPGEGTHRAYIIFRICRDGPSPQPSPTPQGRGEGANSRQRRRPHVPRGFTRRVGGALAGSSGQGCRG